MPIGFRIRSRFERVDPVLVARAKPLPASNIGDCMNRVQCMGPEIRFMGKPGTLLAGPAVTVKTRTGDNLMLHKAMDLAQPGDVVVCDAGGDMRQSIMGEIMARYAEKRGVAGVVIDGPIRDADGLARLDLPVYAKGATPAGPYKDGPGEIGFAITCGGVVVHPGDLIVGDADGIVVVPRAIAAEIVMAAEAHHAKEEKMMAGIARGEWDRAWVDEALRARGCEFLD